MRRLSFGIVLATLLASHANAADSQCVLRQIAELPVTMSGTQPIISGTINGAPMRFLVDSGAFFSILSRESAQKLQLREGPTPDGLIISGVGGAERMGLTKVKEFSLAGFVGGYSFNNVDFLVSGNLVFNTVDGLIGQNILSAFDIEYDLANGMIRLFRAKDCDDRSLAYWHGNATIAEMRVNKTTPASPHWISDAKINGKRIRVLFDSGAWRSTLDRAAAAKVGIKPESEGVITAGVASGFGRRTVELVFARFDTLDLGGEQIKNARLFVGDLSRSGNADLLLGADFFLSHRMYFAPKQNKLYFTYNGGPVFDLRPNGADRDASAAMPTSTATPEPDSAATAGASELMSAATLRRRGTASAGRGNFQSAMADFDQAIKLDPNDADNYYERGKAHARGNQLEHALGDYDQALKLKPEFVSVLIARGAVRLATKDEAGARTDFDAALRLEPKDSGNALGIAQTFASFDHHAEAIQRLNAWIETFPEDNQLPRALNSRCWSRAIVGKEFDLALADCNLALKKGPRNSQVLDSRAFVYLRRGDYDKSIADYQAVLKLQPKQAVSMYGLGLAEFKKGRKAEGEKHLQAAIALSPNVAEFYRHVGLAP